MDKPLWLVRDGIRVCICNAVHREDAKKQSNKFLLGNPDLYVVTPLTVPSDEVCINVHVTT